MRGLGPILTEFAATMRRFSAGAMTFEQVRDKLRRKFHLSDPAAFSYGPNTKSIDKIARAILDEKCYGTGRQICMVCGYVDSRSYGMLECYLSAGLNSRIILLE
jgi:hypothetical protein